MSFRERIEKPAILIPIGMMFLVIALTLPRMVHPTHAANWFDGLRGFLFGIAIGLNLMAVIFVARQNNKSAC